MKLFTILTTSIALLFAACGRQGANLVDAQTEALRREIAEMKLKLVEQETKLRTVEEDAVAKSDAAGKATANAEAASKAATEAAAKEEAMRALAEERTKLETDRAQMLAQQAQLDAAQRAAAEAELKRREDALREEQKRLAAERDAAKRALAEAREQQKAELARREAEARAEAKRTEAKRKLDLFYDALDPLGTWVELEKYGYVFQPHIAQQNRTWRPYTEGSWVLTDQGWAWKSNEQFGWATFHYGRWLRLVQRGWVWVPGTEWAPAWVAWRWSATHIGWAPLPPEAVNANGFNSGVDDSYDIGAGSYVFILRESFCESENYAQRVAAPAQNGEIIQKTENITNLTYSKVNQQRVLINLGPDPKILAAERAKPVPTLKLEKRDVPGNGPSEVKAGTLELAAPDIQTGTTEKKPRDAKPKESGEPDRGWHGMPPELLKLLRDRIAAEAKKAHAELTPPAGEKPAKP